MKVILATLVVSTCNALPGSHFQVTIGGTSYSHGTKDDQPFKVDLPALATSAPVSQNDIQTTTSSSLVNSTTSPPTHAPLFYKSPDASDKIHLTEAPPAVAPVYESRDSVYHSGIKYVAIPKNKTSPTLLKDHKSPKSNAEPQKQKKTSRQRSPSGQHNFWTDNQLWLQILRSPFVQHHQPQLSYRKWCRHNKSLHPRIWNQVYNCRTSHKCSCWQRNLPGHNKYCLFCCR